MPNNTTWAPPGDGKSPTRWSLTSKVLLATGVLCVVCSGGLCLGGVGTVAGLTALGNSLEAKFQKVSDSVD